MIMKQYSKVTEIFNFINLFSTTVLNMKKYYVKF